MSNPADVGHAGVRAAGDAPPTPDASFRGVAHDFSSALGYALYGLLARRTIALDWQDAWRMPPQLMSAVRRRRVAIEEAKPGGWFEFHETVTTVDLGWLLGRGGRVLGRIQCFLLGSRRATGIFERIASDIYAAFLKATDFCSDRPLPVLVPAFGIHRRLVERFGGPDCHVSVLLAVCIIAAGLLHLGLSIVRALRFSPALKGRRRIRLAQAITRGFEQKNYTELVYVDGEAAAREQLVLFSEKAGVPLIARTMARASELGIAVDDISSRSIHLAGPGLWVLCRVYLLALPLSLAAALVTAPWCISALVWFSGRARPYIGLLSRIAPDYVNDPADETNGITTPIVSDLFNTKTILLSHTSTEIVNDYRTSLIRQHVFFQWGPQRHWRTFRHSAFDEIWSVGCMMANCFRNTDRLAIRRELGLDLECPIVVFFDNAYGERFREPDYANFISMVAQFSQQNPELAVVLKAKAVVPLDRESELTAANVVILTKNDIWLGDMIEAADICVGMGITNVTQVALYRGKPTVLLDVSGYRMKEYEPFEGTLVLRNAESVLCRLGEMLCGAMDFPEIRYFAQYSAPNVDTFALVREYIKSGTLPATLRVT